MEVIVTPPPSQRKLAKNYTSGHPYTKMLLNLKSWESVEDKSANFFLNTRNCIKVETNAFFINLINFESKSLKKNEKNDRKSSMFLVNFLMILRRQTL